MSISYCNIITLNGKRAYNQIMRQKAPARSHVYFLAVVFEGGLVFLWLIVGQWLEMSPSEQGHISVKAFVLGGAATLPLLPLMFFVSRSRYPPLRRLMLEIDELLVPFLSRLTVADFAVVAILAGFGEEGLVRGLLQGWLAENLSPATGLVAASTLFGLLHFVTPAYALLAGLLGLYLGILYLATGNIVVPIVVHALYDFLALLYLVRWRSRFTGKSSDDDNRKS
jgi:membrane protease YdiL (CAAX protease family)